MPQINFRVFKKAFPMTVGLAVKLLNSPFLDWERENRLALALMDMKEPLIDSLVLLQANLPADELLALWNSGNWRLKTDLLFYDRFLEMFAAKIGEETPEEPHILAALAGRWKSVLSKLPDDQLSHGKRGRMAEKLAASENEAVRQIWLAATEGRGTPFLRAYVDDEAGLAVLQHLSEEDARLLPWLDPLMAANIISSIETVESAAAKREIVNFAISADDNLYKLLLAKNMHMYELENDSDYDVKWAAIASRDRFRQPLFFLSDRLGIHTASRKAKTMTPDWDFFPPRDESDPVWLQTKSGEFPLSFNALYALAKDADNMNERGSFDAYLSKLPSEQLKSAMRAD